MKILYVEDNDDNVYMLKNRLSRAGFTVVVATNGAKGIAMASSEQPDLILMDLTLPDIDGEEVTRRLKADPAKAASISLWLLAFRISKRTPRTRAALFRCDLAIGGAGWIDEQRNRSSCTRFASISMLSWVSPVRSICA
jgi:CheY-like chemotaxis protein